MLKTKTFAVVGGDLRQSYLANTLAGKDGGYNIYGMFLSRDVKLSTRVHRSDDIRLVLPQSDILIFPLPMLDTEGFVNTPLCDRKISLEECLDYILPGSTLLAGMIPEQVRVTALERGLDIVDYYQREEFIVLNSVPTAEGAVEIALREMPVTLYGSTCMVIGYGRISKVLVRLLAAFGATVRVAARRYSDMAWAEIHGCETVHISELGGCLNDVDLLFNTVPAVILDEEKLSRLSRRCLLVDLASKPGGIDFDTARTLGLKTIWALSLPGKVAPITAGEITLSTVFNILTERGIV